MKPEAIPHDIIMAFDRLLDAIQTGDLGIVSAADKQTGETRYVLVRRFKHDDDDYGLEPLGYLTPRVFDEVHEPGSPEEEGKTMVTLSDDPKQGPPPMDAYNATGIAEGWIEADEDRQLEAWQYLEDTGLGYKLQGWFGRRLQMLILDGKVKPRAHAE